MKYSDKESNILELKREYSNSILKTISAFSNYDGGKIVIGVDDDRNIVGIDNIKDLKISIENKINNSIEPRPLIEFNERRHNGFTVLEIVVIRGFLRHIYIMEKLIWEWTLQLFKLITMNLLG